MAQNVKVCDIDPELKQKCRKFRFRKEKNNACIMMKVERDTQMIVLDEEYEDCTLEEIQEELPASQPRFLLYSCTQNHGDGRVSYPLSFIFVSPVGCKPEQQMMYAGSKLALVQAIEVTKVYEVRSAEDLTDEWLEEMLQKHN